ncbi:non-hemolytic phospholipase C precursor [Purpureocillium lilacinum]|uniref:Non-hemolytic phospholipase C n=1 Tax=Purpureocillium lilacinum TaxID=33203 RepID=A0A179GUX7_PURLI|nr:non-hemolytic phospholipase C precursor [Purpureocillium lilacinum]OAQ75669.1 non-hemolytic phospholipase C precursor [Purpureocillium lilacinum]OAQ81298.1 non-hemolytic phospholipase C precursor [Purpureocillium lilacinum]GJN69914.1 hypothetical protein PLICBS_003966 [Purpureocillium lilacinum]
MRSNRLAWATAALAPLAAAAGSLKDIKHIVLFMQENRAFDHYFGTMAGVRGFGDPNVQVNNDGRTVFEQPIPEAKNGVDILKPWHINYLGGEWKQATQCMAAGDNGWGAMHSAYNSGLGNNWVRADGAWSLGYFKREDVPTQWDIAEGWTLADMATQSVLAATDPNRIMWMSGSINIPGSPSNPDGSGGIIIDNSATPGCEAPRLNCFPFVWKTFPEYLEDAGISWQVWQDLDNFEDNMLAYFEQYQLAKNGSALRTKGNSYPGLDAFYKAAADGTLPQVSWIVGPQELAEHAPNQPVDGAWLQKKVVDAITSSPKYHETVLIISYDEQGGWADHVVPQAPDRDAAGEWMMDPYNQYGIVPVGPGWRTPRTIVSPWTRGGNVFTERADHTSDIMFVEQWAAAQGYKGVYSKELTQWRRDHMSNLVNAFDFTHSDTSCPDITQPPTPESLPDDGTHYSGNLTLGSLTGPWVGPAKCLQNHRTPRPDIPYGSSNANQNMTTLVEEGFKRVRGKLTEGRYLTFESRGYALTAIRDRYAGVTMATKHHNDIRQRWILHAVRGTSDQFTIQSAWDKKYISGGTRYLGTLTSDESRAQTFTVNYNPNGAMYTLQVGDKDQYVSVEQSSGSTLQTLLASSATPLQWTSRKEWFEIYSVSYLK